MGGGQMGPNIPLLWTGPHFIVGTTKFAIVQSKSSTPPEIMFLKINNLFRGFVL